MKAEINLLVSKICKAEGRKSQVKAGDVREVLKVFVTLVAKEGIQTQNTSVSWTALTAYAQSVYAKLKEKENAKNVASTNNGDLQQLRKSNKQPKSRSRRKLNTGSSRRGAKGKSRTKSK